MANHLRDQSSSSGLGKQLGPQTCKAPMNNSIIIVLLPIPIIKPQTSLTANLKLQESLDSNIIPSVYHNEDYSTGLA